MDVRLTGRSGQQLIDSEKIPFLDGPMKFVTRHMSLEIAEVLANFY
jgi:hypothetical protein